jgi:hypothetical protein
MLNCHFLKNGIECFHLRWRKNELKLSTWAAQQWSDKKVTCVRFFNRFQNLNSQFLPSSRFWTEFDRF